MLRLLESLFGQFRQPSIDEVERDYLNTSRDRVNLEHRQYQIDRGFFRNGY